MIRMVRTYYNKWLSFWDRHGWRIIDGIGGVTMIGTAIILYIAMLEYVPEFVRWTMK